MLLEQEAVIFDFPGRKTVYQNGFRDGKLSKSQKFTSDQESLRLLFINKYHFYPLQSW